MPSGSSSASRRWTALAVPAAQGRGAHSHPRGPAARSAIDRQSHQADPQFRRTESGPTQAFKLSERQAEDILEIRLRQLARLEGIRIEQELAEKRKEEAGLRKLLGTDSALRKQVAREVEDDAKKYGDARRTLIEEAERAAVEVKVIDEPVTVIVSEKGFVRARTGHGHDRSQFAFKTGDALYDAFECRSVDQLIAIGSNGRVYSVSVAQLP